MPSFLSSEPTTPKRDASANGRGGRTAAKISQNRSGAGQVVKGPATGCTPLYHSANVPQELIYENRKLKKSVKLTEGLENQVEDLTESLKRKIENYEEKKERLRVAEESAAANPFAVVLVDGDGYVFPDDLLCQGTSGGEEAAQRLLTEATKYLERYKGAKDWKLIVRIFVNLEGLARKCQQFDIITQSNTLRDFATGFAQSQPLFDFVDVGYGKERADHKIRGEPIAPLLNIPHNASLRLRNLENFTLFVRDMHCKHILFGCCHDNGYIPSLDSWKNNSTVASQISLIQHYQLGEGYKKLPFDIAELSSVFRHAELLPSKGSGSPLSHLSHVPFSIPTQPVGHNRSASMPGGDFSTSAGEVMQTSANGTLKRPRTPSNDAFRNRPVYAQDNTTAPEASLLCDPRLHNVNPTTNATSNSQIVPIQERYAPLKLVLSTLCTVELIR